MDNLQLKSQLTEKQLAIFNQEFEKKKKSPVVAWLFWLFLGGLGAHRLYLGKTVSGLILMGVTLLTAWFTFGIPTFIWLIIDAFLLPKMIGEKNKEIETEILNQVKEVVESENA